jgi:hypothetical protein
MSNQLTISQLISLLQKLPNQNALIYSEDGDTIITGIKVYSQLDRKTGEEIELVAVGHYE